MEGYRKTALLGLSYAQPLALMAMLATISPFSPKIKIAAGVCAATTAILLGEKLYNYCRKNNSAKKTDYHFSKSILGVVGVTATFTSTVKPSVIWNMLAFTAVSAIISPVPYEWLTKSDPQDIPATWWESLKQGAKKFKKMFDKTKNPWPEERIACFVAAVIPPALWTTSLFIPGFLPGRQLLLTVTYPFAIGLSSSRESSLANFGDNILKSFRINDYFSRPVEKERTR